MAERLTSSEIPLPNSKLLLLDLDKTLIDAKYQIVDERIFSEIQRVQSLGWQLGLSSDTALEPLLGWRKRFGMNGPTIAEKGSVVCLPYGTEFTMREAQNFFLTLRNKFSDHLIENKIPFLFGDVTQFIRNKPILNEMADNRLVLLQAYRRCSLSFYGRSIDENGALQIDNGLTKSMVLQTQRLFGGSAPFELEEDFNPDYGIYILAPKSTNKRMGTASLIKSFGVDRVGMIGDSGSDILGKDIAFHYAVGNAKDELKKVADYTATSEYTSGVVEILSKIKS